MAVGVERRRSSIIRAGRARKMPAVGFLSLMLGPSIHHLGPLSTYLRPMGRKVPAMYGLSADTR
jgi:uncharacterized damage-inducible protein DinB